MKRRTFITTAAAGVTASLLPAAAWPIPSTSHLRELATPDLLALTGKPDLIRDLGLRYRQRTPQEDDLDILTDTLRRDINASATVPGASIRSLVRRKIEDDFAHRRIVRLDGWMLSRTEARQSALYSLLIHS